MSDRAIQPSNPTSWPSTPNEGAAMTKRFLYMAPIALAGLAFFEAPANSAVWNSGMARDVATTTAEQTDAPLILVRGGGRGGGGGGGFRGGGGGGGYRGGGGGGYRGGGGYAGGARGGGSWSGVSANRGNFNSANINRGNINTGNINRNVNVSGGGYGGYGGYGWGGVAAGVAAGAVVGAAASSYYAAPAYGYPSSYCPYPTYPNCGLY